MRILVTGSRKWYRSELIIQELHRCTNFGAEPATVVHGAAIGADSIAAAYASVYATYINEPHPANWTKHGYAAGPFRNQKMVDAGADICLAFLQVGEANRGTQDCARRARLAGIPVRVIWSDGRTEEFEPAGGRVG